MNKIFKIIWSVAHGDWVVTSEQASAVQGGTRRAVNRMGLKLSGVALALMMVLGVADRAEAASCNMNIIGFNSEQMIVFRNPAETGNDGSSRGPLDLAAYGSPIEIVTVTDCDFDATTGLVDTTGLSTHLLDITINNGAALVYGGTTRPAEMNHIDLSGRVINDGTLTKVTVTGGGIGQILGISGTGSAVYDIQGGAIEEMLINTNTGSNTVTINNANVGFNRNGSLTNLKEWGIVSGTGNDTITINSGNVTGISAGDGNNTVTLAGGTVYKVQTGAGNDTIYLKGTQFASGGNQTITTGAGDDHVVIDGNTNTDPLNILGTLDGEAGNNTLSVENFTLTKKAGDNFAHIGSASGTDILNFGTVNLNGGSVLNLDENSDPYTLTQLNITAGGQLNATGTTATLNGSVANSGVINLRSASIGNTLLINGNYAGGGVIRMNTDLGSGVGDTASDRLIINNGTVTETTILDIATTGLGRTDEQGITVVELQGTSTAQDNAFVLGSGGTVQSSGLYQYKLDRSMAGVTSSNFVLMSVGLSPRVPVYSLSAAAAETLALSNVGSMRDRGGAYEASARTGVHDLTKTMDGRYWVRARYDRIDQKRGDSGLDQKEFLFQAGYNLVENYHPRNDGTLTRRGLTVGYGDARGDVDGRDYSISDSVNDIYYIGAGKVDTKSYSLGAYQTNFWGNGIYLDLVGQISLMDSTLRDNEGHRAKTQGWNGYLSAELGQTIPIGSRDWRIEPQIQVTLSRTEMDGFNDGEVFVDKVEQNLVRARAGAWLFNNFQTKSGNNTMFYTLANVWHDATKPDRIRLNDAVDAIQIRPETVRTWVEVGVGIQQTLFNDRVTIFGDVRGQRALSSGDRDGLGGQIGIKANW